MFACHAQRAAPSSRFNRTVPNRKPAAMEPRRSSLFIASASVAAAAVLLRLGAPAAVFAQSPRPAAGADGHRVFETSVFSIDRILSRPFDRDVPMGCTGDRVWASSPQGWAFRDDVHWLYLTNLHALDLEIRDEFGVLAPARDSASYFPSHVHYNGALRKEMTASASFTFVLDSVDSPLTEPFRPEKRWTCWSSGQRRDWYEIDFGMPRSVTGFDLFFFADPPVGGCRAPESFEVRAFDPVSAGWTPITPIKVFPERPNSGENRVRFEPVRSRRFRLEFRHAGDRFYTGLYGLKAIHEDQGRGAKRPIPLEITCDKFISSADCLVSVLRVHNPTSAVESIYVDPIVGFGEVASSWRWESDSGPIDHTGGPVKGHEPRAAAAEGHDELHGFPVDWSLRYAVIDEPAVDLTVASGGPAADIASGIFTRRWLDHASPETYKAFGHQIAPGKTQVFKAALELRKAGEPSKIDAILHVPRDRNLIVRASEQDRRDPLSVQVDRYQSWFDKNIAYFACSDPWVDKLYYHRAYVLRKNMLDPRIGRMTWPTQSEGHWRSTWYPNVISYGASHQIREARWLRDAKYSQGHLRTWAENEKPNGVFPGHVTPHGPSGGQYTDWITSAAWEAYLVHPDPPFLAQVADRLAQNVRGWQKTYDPDGDGLLMVDSHWWTGMEYQPSFFAFANYQTSADFSQPARRVNLDRVDLTAYNYGNAVAVARIYRRLGKDVLAQEFEGLAAKIAGAVMEKMWQPDKRYFYSLRVGDGAVANVKEVIGVYPFYFGMIPPGKGFESAWESILDPNQFWTAWPVASASRQCPAYSQTNWPLDGRAAACMWNGPTWPHANSIVMTAMARSLRAARDHSVASTPLSRHHLWQLFHSFTRAQFRDQKRDNPWTGEFYNGDTGEWKTAERDYNHSTWLDVLIPDLIGLVPRDDETLEVDPLLPEDSLSFFILDGQYYRGHDITIAWDSPASDAPDRFGDRRKGLDVYVGGKRVASSSHLARLRISLVSAPRGQGANH
jgi:hypothetical protein